MQEEPVTPRRRRRDDEEDGVTTVAGSGAAKRIVDNGIDQHEQHVKRLTDLIERVTADKVHIAKAQRNTRGSRFILSTESLEYEEQIRDAVNRELRVPWSVDRTESDGIRANSNAFDGTVSGFATLVVHRAGLFVPKTRSVVMILLSAGIIAGGVLAVCGLYWLATIPSHAAY
jgi:hypothetical protein